MSNSTFWAAIGKTCLCGIPPRSDTNRAVQPQKRDCTIYVAKIKALISCTVTAQLICVFVFAFAKAGFLMTQLVLAFNPMKTLSMGICLAVLLIKTGTVAFMPIVKTDKTVLMQRIVLSLH